MTDRQRIALARPCARAMDTIRPCFKRFDPPWSTILTVNK
jgi:hypothetical protein